MENKVVQEGNVELKFEDNKIYVSGNIDCQNPRYFMEPFFSEIHEHMINSKLKKIVIDITALKFLNSSGIRELVDWVMKLDTIPDDQKYAITFLCNPEYLWQESSIATIVFLNSDFVNKEEVYS
ncbi:MAG: STAS domain-containing protein [Spirochaetes bacterium]|nr:STAS domain-containing protein [Spirochaetota bacterium]